MKKTKIKNWWIWDFLSSGIFLLFVLFFGFFATLGYIGEKRKNNSKVHQMKEGVMYIRPAGFTETTTFDTIDVE